MDGGLVSAPVHISAETKAEAAAWLARLRADDRSDADEQAFQAWLRADSAHAVAFEAVTQIWEAAGSVSRAARGALERDRGASVSRRAVMAGIGTAAVAAGSLAVLLREAYAGVYETDVGEQKHVTLDDGTQVFLDTDTRIRVSYSSRTRVVDLERGRANFRVAPDAKRTFVVEAAKKRIVTGRTVFDVRRDGERVSVVLIRGSASVEGPAKPRQTLKAGQRFVASDGARETVDQPNMTQQLAWQMGQAIFDNQTLADAVAEMNRYSSVKLKIADRGIGSLRMSGVYRVGDNASFAHSVTKLLPVEVRAADGHLDLVADLTRMPQG
jgi:transmembrane sensor